LLVTVLRSAVFWIAAIALTLAIAALGIVTLPFPRRVTYRWGVIWAEILLGLMRIVCGLDYRVVGRAHIPATPVIFALKHQSAWETIAFLALAPPIAGVLKRELLQIPVYGWYLRRLGMVPIDRQAAGSAVRELLRRAKAAIADGRSIMIMPEGTRIPPGQTGRYHPGAAALYTMLGVAVVPVALNSGLFWGRRSLLLRPGTITIEFLAPIAPGLDRHAFQTLLQQRIEDAAERLRREAMQGET
jgi:1-acyl-sn-glycerol-3-phosphate acyltransferase